MNKQLLVVPAIIIVLITASCRKNGEKQPGNSILAPAGYAEALSVGRAGMAVASLGNKVFFAGGESYSRASGPTITTYHKAVDIYDAISGKWSIAMLSEARADLAAAAAGNKIVFAGGYHNNVASAKVDIYNIRTGQWTSTNLSEPRSGLAAAAAGNKILFAGGSNGNTISKTVDIYDVVSGQWTTDTLSKSRTSLTAAATGSRILFAGGRDNANNFFNTVDIYDATTGKWTRDTLSEPRWLCGATTAGEKIVVCSGLPSFTDFSNAIDIYDARSGKWTSHSLTTSRYLFGCAAVGNKVVLAGGVVKVNGSVGESSSIEIFDLSSNTSDAFTYYLKEPAANCSAITVGNKLLVAGGVYLRHGTNADYANLKTVYFFELHE